MMHANWLLHNAEHGYVWVDGNTLRKLTLITAEQSEAANPQPLAPPNPSGTAGQDR